MPTFVGFNTFAALPEEQISEKISRRILAGDQGMLVWWSIGAGVHVEPHSHATPSVGDIVGEGVLEGVLQVRKELRRVEKLSSLQIVEQTAKFVLCQPTNWMQEGERGVVSNYRRLMQQTLLGGGQRIDTRGEHRLASPI